MEALFTAVFLLINVHSGESVGQMRYAEYSNIEQCSALISPANQTQIEQMIKETTGIEVTALGACEPKTDGA